MKPSDDLIVSSTEPTGLNRKKVWMQNSKNILNPYNKHVSSASYDFSSDIYKLTSEGSIYLLCKVIVGKSFTLSYKNNNGFASIRASDYNNGGSWIEYGRQTGTNGAITFTPTTETVVVQFVGGAVNSSTVQKLQLEQGSIATSYEEYIEPKIYIRNDNNVYEEFTNKEKKNVYRITDEAEHSNGENNYTLRIQDELVIFSFNPLWINSITADTWVKLCSIPQEIIPNITVGNLALITDGGTGNIIGNAKIEVRTDGGLYAKPNITKTSYVSGITGMLCWFIN